MAHNETPQPKIVPIDRDFDVNAYIEQCYREAEKRDAARGKDTSAEFSRASVR